MIVPAIRCNLFVFKGKTKRISTPIGGAIWPFIVILKKEKLYSNRAQV
jgi:hypothetical protein